MDTNTKSDLKTTAKTETFDVLAQKSQEYNKLPGHILGLDGWILRAIEPELREQFLTGYAKLLKVAFHPDRFQDPAKKLSRQNFIQQVSEATEFLLSDAMAYEITMETVPSRKNPMVALREQIAVRDTIIARVDAELNHNSGSAKLLRKDLEQTRTQLEAALMESERRLRMELRLRSTIRHAVVQHPVPLTIRAAQITGYFVDLSAKSQVMETLAAYASTHNMSDQHDWICSDAFIKIARKERLLTKKLRLNFRKGKAIWRMMCNQKYTCRITGAMTMAHLCEFIRVFHNYPDNLDAAQAMRAIDRILEDREEWTQQDESDLKSEINPFVLPFYVPNMLLLVKTRRVEKGIEIHDTPRLRLFVVEQVDAGINPNKAIKTGVENELLETRKELWDTQSNLTSVSRSARGLRRSADSARAQVERYKEYVLKLKKLLLESAVKRRDLRAKHSQTVSKLREQLAQKSE